MLSLLFHKDVFIPKGAQYAVSVIQSRIKNYTLSRHFEEHLNNQANEDRSHTYFRNYVINTLNEMISDSRVIRDAFEIEMSKSYREFGTHNWIVTKYCIRLPYDSQNDLVIVIRPRWNKETLKYNVDSNLVVTAWMNHKSDDHKTLDGDKYCSEKRWNEVNK